MHDYGADAWLFYMMLYMYVSLCTSKCTFCFQLDPPESSVQPNVVESSLTGTAVFNYTVQANPPILSQPVVFEDGNQVVDRITVSNTTITFSDIRCRDNGTYTLQSTNAVGSGNVTFSLVVTRSECSHLVYSRTK